MPGLNRSIRAPQGGGDSVEAERRSNKEATDACCLVQRSYEQSKYLVVALQTNPMTKKPSCLSTKWMLILSRSSPTITHQFKVWGRFASTEIRESPSSIPQHRELGAFLQLFKQWPQGAMLQDKVPALWRVSSNVSQGPHGLQDTYTAQVQTEANDLTVKPTAEEPTTNSTFQTWLLTSIKI